MVIFLVQKWLYFRLEMVKFLFKNGYIFGKKWLYFWSIKGLYFWLVISFCGCISICSYIFGQNMVIILVKKWLYFWSKHDNNLVKTW